MFPYVFRLKGGERAFGHANAMSKKIFGRVAIVGILLLLVLFAYTAGGAESGNPIETNIEISPSTLTNTGSVRVNISVSNVMDEGQTVSVTLYDPNNNVVPNFGSGGTANITAGSAMGYSGSWTVTSAQLESGKIQYTVRYKFYNGAGEQVSGSKPITGRITYQTAKPSVEIERILPASSITEGQTAQVTYIFTNTGTVEVNNIRVEDPGINSEALTCQVLPVGESVELSHSFIMSDKPMTTEARLSYQYLDGSETKTSSTTCKAVTFEVAHVDVLVQLAANKMVVNAGDKVTLTCVITNRGDLAYSQLRITDENLGDLDSGISIDAGKSYTCTKEITVSESGAYLFTVLGVDSFGTPVEFKSNSLTIQIPSEAPTGEVLQTNAPSPLQNAEPVELAVVIDADREIIYEMPSEIIFTIKVTNAGLAETQNINLRTTGYYGKTVDTIDSLMPGETATIQRVFQASMGGQYQFAVTAKNGSGEEATFESNIIKVVYQSLATPTPTAVPTPPPTIAPTPVITPEPTVATPFSGGEEESTSFGGLLRYILIGIVVLMVAAIVLLVVLDRRKNAKGYGTMERATHRDYTRAPKKGTVSQPVRNQYGDDYDDNSDPDEQYGREESNYQPEYDSTRAYLPHTRRRGADRRESVEYDTQQVNDTYSSDEADAEAESSILSGSTGEYRLSSQNEDEGSPVGTPANQGRRVADPQAFSHSQRTSRKQSSDFYDDE